MSTKPAVNEAIVVAFRDAAAFEAWLDAHVDLRVGVWLKIAKKGSGVPSLTSDEAVDVGLCYGWISGQRKSCDEVYYLQKYVPRRRRSNWSRVNVAKVEELIAAGRMRPSGLARGRGGESRRPVDLRLGLRDGGISAGRSIHQRSPGDRPDESPRLIGRLATEQPGRQGDGNHEDPQAPGDRQPAVVA